MPIIFKINFLYFFTVFLSPNLLPFISKSKMAYIGFGEVFLPLLLVINAVYILLFLKNHALCPWQEKTKRTCFWSIIIFYVYFVLVSFFVVDLSPLTMLLRNTLAILLFIELVLLYRLSGYQPIEVSLLEENYISSIRWIALIILTIGILEFFFPDFVRNIYQYKISARGGMRFGMTRIASSIVNCNVFGSFAGLFLINSLVTFKDKHCLLNFVIICLSILSILLSGSKGALFGICIALTVYLLIQPKSILKLLCLIVAITFFIITLIVIIKFYDIQDFKILSSGSYLASIGHIYLPAWTKNLPNSFVERLFLAYVYFKAYFHGINIIRLLFGGIDETVVRIILKSRDIFYGPHNSYIYILCSSGLIGIFLFIRMLRKILGVTLQYAFDNPICQVVFLWTVALISQSFFDSLMGINSKANQIFFFLLPAIFLARKQKRPY